MHVGRLALDGMPRFRRISVRYSLSCLLEYLPGMRNLLQKRHWILHLGSASAHQRLLSSEIVKRTCLGADCPHCCTFAFQLWNFTWIPSVVRVTSAKWKGGAYGGVEPWPRPRPPLCCM